MLFKLDENEIEQQHNKHLDEQATARSRMNNDLHAFHPWMQDNSTLEILTYDMEKTLPLPRMPTNIILQKENLVVQCRSIFRKN